MPAIFHRLIFSREKAFPCILITCSVSLFFFALGSRDLWAPVEPRYGEIVRVMFARGEWIVPRVNGELYTDKPIFYFWSALIAAKLLGSVNEWSVRLPAALGGVGYVMATYYIGREFFTAKTAFIAALILATSLRVIWEARWAHVDMVFGFFFLAAIYFFARALLLKKNPRQILLGYVFMALATLTKGLIGVVLPGLLFLSFICLRRDWRLLGDSKLAVGAVVFLAMAAPWFLLVSQATDGKWLADFVHIHHFQRYTAGAGHREPFYYYLTTLPADFMPWTILLVPALLSWRSIRHDMAQLTWLFLLLWFFLVLLFFSLSDTKRDLYLLPLMPALALYLAFYLNRALDRGAPPDPWCRWFTIIGFSILIGVAAILPVAAWLVRREALGAIVPASLVIALGSGCALSSVLRQRLFLALGSITALMTLTIVTLSLCFFPYLEKFNSPQPLASKIKSVVPAAARLYIFADSMHDYNYYTAREVIPILRTAAQVDAVRARGHEAYLLIRQRDLSRNAPLQRAPMMLSHPQGGTTWYLLRLSEARSK